MKVKIKVFATLRDKLGWKEKICEVGEESTVGCVLEGIGEIREIVFDRDGKVNSEYRIFINGRYIDFAGGLNGVLKDYDEIAVFPAIAGG